MFRIDSDGAVIALETPGAVGATVGYFSEGNPGTGVEATVVSSDWLNAVQEEIMAVLTAAGITSSKTTRTQLRDSVKQLALGGDISAVSSADKTITSTDLIRTVLMTTGASNRTVNLPAAASNSGRRIVIQKVDSGVGTVIIDPNASETINGATTFTITNQYSKAELVCDGTNWILLGAISNSGATVAVSSADKTLTSTDLITTLLMTTGASNRTVNLPAAANNTGRKILVKKVDSGVGTVIIDGNASETINGATTFTIQGQYSQAEIICDGSNWLVLGAIGSTGALTSINGVNLTITATDGIETLLAVTGASDRTITLPAVNVSAGRKLLFKKWDSGVGKLIIDGAGSESIDGDLTVSLTKQYNFIEIICDGALWHLTRFAIEPIQSLVSVYANSAATNVYGNVTTISVPQGTYLISGHVAFKLNGATVQAVAMAISENSGNTTTDHIEGHSETPGAVPTSSFNVAYGITDWLYHNTSGANATIYLKQLCSFTVGTPQCRGRITAKRVG